MDKKAQNNERVRLRTDFFLADMRINEGTYYIDMAFRRFSRGRISIAIFMRNHESEPVEVAVADGRERREECSG